MANETNKIHKQPRNSKMKLLTTLIIVTLISGCACCTSVQQNKLEVIDQENIVDPQSTRTGNGSTVCPQGTVTGDDSTVCAQNTGTGDEGDVCTQDTGTGDEGDVCTQGTITGDDSTVCPKCTRTGDKDENNN